ncbi:MAG: hypothetical protein UDG86_03470 [Lachnospiraceae bacterium]|nr:hypothetical protein [Lachnospiraceae bacterium]
MELKWRSQPGTAKAELYRKVGTGGCKLYRTLSGKSISYRISLDHYSKKKSYKFYLMTCYLKNGKKIWSKDSNLVSLTSRK